MKVSILTVTFNSEDTIVSALESLKGQSYSDIEHIIKDGGSTDGTLELIRRNANRSKLVSEPDNGIYDALNEAIRISSGEIIGILHADDFLNSSDVIQRVVDLFEHSNCDAVYGDLKYVKRQFPEKIVRIWKSGTYKEGAFLYGWMPPHPAFFVKREVIEKYGSYNTDFKSAADYEWMLRLIHKHKIKLAYLPQILVSMRVGGKSNKNLKNRLLANLEDRKAWKVNDLRPRWFTLWTKPIAKLKQWF